MDKRSNNIIYRVYIYGCGRKYDEIASVLFAYKDTVLDIMGIITTDEPEYKIMDGLMCCKAERILSSGEYDFIIVTPDDFKEIVHYLRGHGVPEEKIVLGKVFKLPYFNPHKYFELRKRKMSIFSENCLAGIVYSILGFRVNVPTYNCSCKPKTYYKFLSKLPQYLNTPMEQYDEIIHGPIEEKDFKRKWMPKGVLMNNKDMIWYFNHTFNVEESIRRWNEKRLQVNLDDVIALCVIGKDDIYELFCNLKMSKIGFSFTDYDDPNIIYVREWNDSLKARYIGQYNFGLYIMYQMSLGVGMKSSIDWISLLCGDKDYRRF